MNLHHVERLLRRSNNLATGPRIEKLRGLYRRTLERKEDLLRQEADAKREAAGGDLDESAKTLGIVRSQLEVVNTRLEGIEGELANLLREELERLHIEAPHDEGLIWEQYMQLAEEAGRLLGRATLVLRLPGLGLFDQVAEAVRKAVERVQSAPSRTGVDSALVDAFAEDGLDDAGSPYLDFERVRGDIALFRELAPGGNSSEQVVSRATSKLLAE